MLHSAAPNLLQLETLADLANRKTTSFFATGIGNRGGSTVTGLEFTADRRLRSLPNSVLTITQYVRLTNKEKNTCTHQPSFNICAGNETNALVRE